MSFCKFLISFLFVTMVFPALFESAVQGTPTLEPLPSPAVEIETPDYTIERYQEDKPPAEPAFVNLLFGVNGIRITSYGTSSDIFFIVAPPIILLLTFLLVVTAILLYLFLKMSPVVRKRRPSQFYLVGRTRASPIRTARKEDLEKYKSTIISEKESHPVEKY